MYFRHHINYVYIYTVWPEILAGKYFGGLLKICHLVEFTLAVEPVLAIIIFIAKWLIGRAGNLTGPCGSFRSVRTKAMIKCKLNKSLLRLIWTVFVHTVCDNITLSFCFVSVSFKRKGRIV